MNTRWFRLLVLSGAGIAIGSLATVMPTSAGTQLAGRQVVIWSAGGALAEAMKSIYFQPFEEATGAKVKVIESGYDQALALAAAQVKAGNPEWDALAMVDAPAVPRLVDEGIIQKIDLSAIPSADALAKGAATEFGIAAFSAAVTVSYRKADGVTPMTSVADFFDPDIKAPRAAGGTAEDAQVMCVLALLADGVPAKDLAPLDIDRCLAVWDRIKDQVTVWWTSGSEMAQAMIDNQVDYCLCFDGRIVQAAKTNPSWTLTHQGGVQFFSYITYINGTKNADVLNALIDFMSDPKRQAAYTEKAGYSAPNPQAIQYLPDQLKAFLSVTPEAQGKLTVVPEDVEKALAKQQQELGRKWMQWLSI
jgi:putative spermidine/putrescine transport system substrate-binding protein